MSAISVSVIVPVYNTGAYLNRCLESLTCQTLTDIEIICVDNGSTDGSRELLSDYRKKHKNITVLDHPQGRQGAARNAGLKVARGEYIGFVDSDDYISNEMFERMYRAAKRQDAEVAICNMLLHFQRESRFALNLPDSWFVEHRFSIAEHPVFLRNMTICNKLFKRDLIRQNTIRFPEGMFHEDQLFVIKAFFLATSIIAVNSPLYVYRKKREGSVSAQNDNTSFSIFEVMRRAKAFLSDWGLFDRHRKLFGELETIRYLMLFDALQKKYKKRYFERMRLALKDTALGPPLEICTPGEYRRYLLIKNGPYPLCAISFFVRARFGEMLSVPAVRRAYQAFKGKMNACLGS